jgi:hypothetical protein
MHFSQLTRAGPLAAIAPNGQASTQTPQAEQRESSTRATKPDDASIGLLYLTIASMPAQQHLQQLQIA